MKTSSLTIVLTLLIASSGSFTDCGNKASEPAQEEVQRSESAEESADIQVIPPPEIEPDGITARREDFPAICSFPDLQGNPNCTCVLVGPRAALTALHCVNPQNELITPGKTFNREVEILGHGTREEECIPAQQAGLDLAICHVREVNDIAFERVGRFPPSSNLVLTGFGCTEFLQSTDGKLRQRPVPLGTRLPNSLLLTLGGQFLCGGDSGGPGFVLLQRGGTEEERLKGPRLVVGINHSRTELTNLTTTGAQDFFAFWLSGHPDSPICGFHSQAQGCRPS